MEELSRLLDKELKRRQKNNPAYSLRAFARYLDISPAALSQLISGKRGVSTKRLDSILEKLGFSPKDKAHKLKNQNQSSKKKFDQIKEDQFKLISQWYHFAILSLGELKDASSDPRWIAKRLNIKVSEANQALTRLERLGIIELDSKGGFRQIGESIHTTTDIPSQSIREYHKSLLGLAQNKLETIPVELREYSSMTMAINSKNLKKAKDLTLAYKNEMLELLERGRLDEVYQLQIQLFPLSDKD